MKRVFALAAVLLLWSADDVPAAEPQSAGTRDAIEHLLNRVAESEFAFIRNGKTHSGEDAAKHMRRKYEHFSGKIKSPEDFIRLAATKSLMSGKPYTVVTPDGELATADWLTSALAEHRMAVGQSSAAKATLVP